MFKYFAATLNRMYGQRLTLWIVGRGVYRAELSQGNTNFG